MPILEISTRNIDGGQRYIFKDQMDGLVVGLCKPDEDGGEDSSATLAHAVDGSAGTTV